MLPQLLLMGSLAAAPAPIRFITNRMCPFAQRAHIALEESGVAFELEEIELYPKPAWFTRLSPKGKIPVIVTADGSVITESETICDWVADAALPAARLRPDGADERAACARWRERVNGELAPVGKRAVTSSARSDLAALLRQLDGEVRGDFLAGDDFSLADVSALPFLQRIHEEYGFPAECEKLEAWYARASRRPCFSKTRQASWWWWW